MDRLYLHYLYLSLSSERFWIQNPADKKSIQSEVPKNGMVLKTYHRPPSNARLQDVNSTWLVLRMQNFFAYHCAIGCSWHEGCDANGKEYQRGENHPLNSLLTIDLVTSNRTSQCQ